MSKFIFLLVCTGLIGCAGFDPGTGSSNSSSGLSLAKSADLLVLRFDGQTGSALVSNGVPLPMGALTAANIDHVRVFVNNVEQSIYVEALPATHKDGSLKSILVQFDFNFSSTAPITGVITWDSLRLASPKAKVVVGGVPNAVALPNDPNYLVSTKLGGELKPFTDPKINTVVGDQMKQDFAGFAVKGYNSTNQSFARGIAIYEHLLTHYQYWLMTGDPTWYHMASVLAENYRIYTEAQSGNMGEWLNTTEGITLHYLLTGDEAVRVAIGKQVHWLMGATEYSYPIEKPDGNYRIKARAISAALDCYAINCDPGIDGYVNPYTNKFNIKAILDSYPARFFQTQVTSGLDVNGLPAAGSFPSRFNGNDYNGGQKNYMVGMFLTAVTRYFDEYKSDPAILPKVQLAVDYLWNTQWDTATKGFWYCSATSVPGKGDCNHSIANGYVDNTLNVTAMMWVYSKTKNVTYRNRADSLIDGVYQNKPSWVGFVQQFDMAYYRFFNYLAKR